MRRGRAEQKVVWENVVSGLGDRRPELEPTMDNFPAVRRWEAHLALGARDSE